MGNQLGTTIDNNVKNTSTPETNKYKVLAKEIAELINKHGMENESNTPDYILGNYLVNCLLVYNATIKDREDHKGLELEKVLKQQKTITGKKT